MKKLSFFLLVVVFCLVSCSPNTNNTDITEKKEANMYLTDGVKLGMTKEEAIALNTDIEFDSVTNKHITLFINDNGEWIVKEPGVLLTAGLDHTKSGEAIIEVDGEGIVNSISVGDLQALQGGV